MPQGYRKEERKNSLRQRKGKSFINQIRQEALLNALRKGSITVEASFVLPMFLFVMVMVLFLFRILQIQYIVGNSLDTAVSRAALLRETSAEKVESAAKILFYKELVVQNCPINHIRAGVAGFSWKSSQVDENYVDMKVTYNVKFPIPFFGKRRMELSEACRVHRWTGYDMASANEGRTDWVYVTPNGTVYHESRSCTHLKLSIQYISISRLKTEFSEYVPCSYCGREQRKSGKVYVTDEGQCYHTRIDCSGLKRTIYMIRKDQTGGRTPCQRCQGG